MENTMIIINTKHVISKLRKQNIFRKCVPPPNVQTNMLRVVKLILHTCFKSGLVLNV